VELKRHVLYCTVLHCIICLRDALVRVICSSLLTDCGSLLQEADDSVFHHGTSRAPVCASSGDAGHWIVHCF
jgi:hypothetical protein